MTPMKIEILSSCVAAGAARKVGEIVEVSEGEYLLLKSYSFAQEAAEPAQEPETSGDVLVMTHDGLKKLNRKDQLALAKDMNLDLPKKATEDEIIEAILDASKDFEPVED